ncbi:hypothetical protein [Acinetobacter sp. ESBL14]|uniref:hypothetical protein n=1 Tax=Acinetobacter sp. ESBL14 TaxID=3077329 RepID=UPI002FC9DB6C
MNILSVESISELLSIKGPVDGQVVIVKNYYDNKIGLGGNFVYRSENINKTDNGIFFNGWERQVEGEYLIEFWGVVSDGKDQSLNIQKALDFCLKNSINYLTTLGKSSYLLDRTIFFKPSLVIEPWGYGDKQFVFDLKGTSFITNNDSLTFFKILRDHILIKNIGIFGTYGKQQRGIVYGYDMEEKHIANTRESVMWCGLDNVKFGGLDIGMQLNPNYGGYGMYYHKFCNIDARDVKILIYGEQTTTTKIDIDAGRGSNKVTRTEFKNITHNRGSCTIFFKDIETTNFSGIYAEDINYDDSRLPDGKAVCVFIPKAQSYNQLAYDNNGLSFNGAFEYINRSYNFQQPNQPVIWDVVDSIALRDEVLGKQGESLVISGSNIGKNLFNRNLNINNNLGSIDAYPVTMIKDKTSPSDRASYPFPDSDFWGALINISSTAYQSPETMQILGSAVENILRLRFFSSGNWSNWQEILTTKNSYGLGSSWKYLENQNLNNFKFTGGGLRIAQVNFNNGNISIASSYPQNNNVYGALAWIGSTSPNSQEGMQVLFSVSPLNIYYRAYTSVWSEWRRLSTSS